MKTFDARVTQRPAFRRGVVHTMTDVGSRIDYKEQGADLEFPAELHEGVAVLLAGLSRGGQTVTELAASSRLSGEEITIVLGELDELGLIVEACPEVESSTMTGAQFYRTLSRYTRAVQDNVLHGRYYQALLEGSITRQQLIGFACEYYHLVHLAPSLMAPALAVDEGSRAKALTLQFFEEELHHDRFLTKALATVGIGEELLEKSTPLPTTFGVCATLAALARQNPLAFKAALFLFEQPYSEFNTAFRARCEALGLPAVFHTSITKHSELNDQADHANITQHLLAEVAAVTAEEARVVKRELAVLVETLGQQDDEILAYYGRPDAQCPRLFH
ncbi:MAG TPA: iron-containing redox enzyme family protein [Polyangiaceae bacterium]|nr:iron-containing redox enzyme family protein [Polyangiaceae bacterium]